MAPLGEGLGYQEVPARLGITAATARARQQSPAGVRHEGRQGEGQCEPTTHCGAGRAASLGGQMPWGLPP